MVSEGLAHIVVGPDSKGTARQLPKNAQEEQKWVPAYKIRVLEGPVYLLLFFTICIYHLDSEPQIFVLYSLM